MYNEPIYENKSTEKGMKKRLALLSKYYAYKAKDDVVDALCLAVIGMRGGKNEFITMPENPLKESKGIMMQMVQVRL